MWYKKLYEKQEKEFAQKIFSLSEIKEGRDEIFKNILKLPYQLTEEDFLEFLERILKYPDGIEVIKNNWKILLRNSIEPIRTLEVYKKNQDIEKEVVHNVPYLIQYSGIKDIGLIAKALEDFEGGKKAIVDNFEDLFEYAYTNFDVIFCSTLETKEGINIAKAKFDSLKSKAPISEFFRVIEKLEDNPEFKEEAEKYSFWKNLYKQSLVTPPEIPDLDELICLSEEEIIKLLRLIDAPNRIDGVFKKLMMSEELDEKRMILEYVSNGNKFEYLSHGADSLLLKTGEQVVKLDSKKHTFEIPYHPRIMMPYFRKRYKDDQYLEVYNLGITESAKITDEQLLSIYKELEEAGILWGDARKENLLVLKQDNKLPDFIKSKHFNLFGFLNDLWYPTNNHVALKKGDIVICDLDYLYSRGDPEYREGILDDVIIQYLADKQRRRQELER